MTPTAVDHVEVHPDASVTHVSPSLLAADPLHLARDISRVTSADSLHVDVMDQHFVPNLGFSAHTVHHIARFAPQPIDVHLMVERPGQWVDDFASGGADHVTFHIEATDDPVTTARAIRAAGSTAGLAFRPSTPLAPYAKLMAEFDLVLVMTIEPGFGGQPFLDTSVPRVREARELIERLTPGTRLQVDGGMTTTTVRHCATAGADSFVAGTAIFGSEDPDLAIRRLRECAMDGRR